MTGRIIDGKAISEQIRRQIKSDTDRLIERGCRPGLAVVLVGDNQASRTYVTNKKKASLAAGMKSELIELPSEVSQQALLNTVDRLNRDPSIHGILVQLPLPPHIDESAVIQAISPKKDVDGFHPENVGKMIIGQDSFISCTPAGIMELLKQAGVGIAGKHAVILGRSNIVGKPMGQLLLQQDATVTYCHSKTENLETFTRQADILIAAIGQAKFITADHVKQGAVVIDVGMNRDEHGKRCGDVDFDSVREKASAITPVPGGVGPMTVTMLLKNTLKSATQTCSNYISTNG
ncbi:bifunctional protein FolD [Sporosarcina sp. NCCP-2716]|uniref:bifunctional methylenetetrahydrofolate dehydrogenase/methenyltetrahydrofolate cyclohydrolase FolD n=1 Tax=Sporosarcina sp. NCCP-2716 TaxID=2943679 RepID=UPI002041F5A9|nr:bifunctional methylenetetrahydrofolate dehydrogenase/methenyltetrahydrofolate cyclohydrolase FolD [Sporosarcina sp. NCCP-2716]GKV68118.1 bifunctional protein FolD [Sporosarcina sp. NCCP-2716]